MEPSTGSDDSAVLDLLHLIAEDERRGALRTIDEYRRRFPGRERALERVWRSREESEPREVAPRAIGAYRLVRELGRGGQSVVYLAEDTRLPRKVALKVLRSTFDGALAPRKARLRREAEVIAQLDHPNLCAILEAELDHDPPYMAMRWIEGETLAHHIASDVSGGLARPRDAASLRRTLRFFERAALALHVAHEAGIVHRDIKPGNLMIDERGEPVVVDFGLARALDDATLTRAHEAVGTPAYMSPEQLRGSADRVDRRCDVYALGVTLYECLTARRPYLGDGSAQLIEAITSAPLPDARSLNAALPTDVAVVLETALERDLARRYPTALELASDLRRIIEYRPIAARPAPAWLRLRRWTQRHPALAGTISVLLVALLVSLQLLREREIAQQRLQGSGLATLSLSMVEQDPTRALLLAIDAARIERGFYSDSALIAALAQCRERRSIALASRAVDATFLPDGRRAVFAGADGEVVVVDLGTGEAVGELRGHTGNVNAVAASADGRSIATASSDGTARLWRTDTFAAERVLAGHTTAVRRVAFSADGRRVATASDDATARVWDTASGELAFVCKGHDGLVSLVAFSGDGQLLLTASGPVLDTGSALASDRTARVWNGSTGEPIATLAGHASFLRDARFTLDGARVVTASEDGTARVWDARSGELLATRACPGPVHCAAPSPRGEWIALAHENGALLWRFASGDAVELAGHLHGTVRSAEFSPDGTRVVTGADDRTARVWSVPDGRELATLRRADHRVIACRWSADAESILTTTWTKAAHVWYASRLPGIDVLEGHGAPIETARFDATGGQLLTAARDGEIRVWTVAGERRIVRGVAAPGRPIASAAWSESGDAVVTLARDGSARIDDLRAGRSLDVAPGRLGPWRGAQVDRAGARVLVWSEAGELRVVDAHTAASVAAFEIAPARVTQAALSDDGRRVAAGAADGSTRVWSLEPAALLHDFGAFDGARADLREVRALAWSRDGALLASAHTDRSIELFDVAAGVRRSKTNVSGTPARASFSADGKLLMLVPRSNPFVVLFDGASGVQLGPIGDQRFDAHVADVTCAAFSPDGAAILTGSYDGTARLWSARDGSRRLVLDARAGPIQDVAFAPDGVHVVTAHADGSVRVWPVDPLPLALERRPREWTETERVRYLGR